MKEQNFKVGDTLLCKYNSVSLIKGNLYVIGGIYCDSKYNGENNIYHIAVNSNFLSYLSFYNEESLYEYFYSKKEERKIKLERLYNL